eukprot:UN33113
MEFLGLGYTPIISKFDNRKTSNFVIISLEESKADILMKKFNNVQFGDTYLGIRYEIEKGETKENRKTRAFLIYL